MLIVADTSALVALAACDALSLLDELFREVSVPPTVLRECTVLGKPEAGRLNAYLQSKVVEVDLGDSVIAVTGLGEGELEAMALYRRLRAERLLIDDRRARKVARLNKIEIIGSLGVLLWAKEVGLIAEIRPLLAVIKTAGIHYSEQLVGEALRQAGELE